MRLKKFAEDCIGKRFIKTDACYWNVKGFMICKNVNYISYQNGSHYIYSATFQDEKNNVWYLTTNEVELFDNVDMTEQDIINQIQF